MSTETKSDLEYLIEILKEANKTQPTLFKETLLFFCKRALQRKESDEQKQQQEALNNAREFWNFKNIK